jgi:hypothetical protein
MTADANNITNDNDIVAGIGKTHDQDHLHPLNDENELFEIVIILLSVVIALSILIPCCCTLAKTRKGKID